MTEGSPNLFAWAALALFGPLMVVVFARLRPHAAAAWGMLGATLFLPEVIGFDPPYLPSLDKLSLASLWVGLGCAWTSARRLRAGLSWGTLGFFGLMAAGQLGTALTNPDALVTGAVVRPALSLYDGTTAVFKDALLVLAPFVLGRAMFRAEGERRELLRILVVAALVYSAFALFELRMSPQSHRLAYGYHPASFEMTLRGGGYRPTIFMITGLAVAMFFLAAAIISVVRARTRSGRTATALWLTAILVACKSTGAIVYGLFILPVLALLRRPVFAIPMLLGALVFTYPVARAAGVVPTRAITDVFMNVSEARALSLWFRFDNEDRLLARALERPWFGWGSYGRQRVFDPRTGDDTTVTDGHWIIVVGERGAVGYIGAFGLLLAPLFSIFRARRRFGSRAESQLAFGVAMIVAASAVDLLPNGLFSTLPYFFSGVLAGAVPSARTAAPRRATRGAVRAVAPAAVA